MKNRKLNIVMDVDGVLASFCEGIIEASEQYNLESFFPKSSSEVYNSEVYNWNISEKFLEVFNNVKDAPEFWLNLPVLNKINFTPLCYLTARPIKSEITSEWLDKNNFPKAEVITVKNPLDKIKILQDLKADLFIDDHWLTIIECKKNGINSVLFEQPYQIAHREEIEKHNLKVIDNLENVEQLY